MQGNLLVRDRGSDLRLVSRIGTLCRWAAGVACRVEGRHGLSAGAACRSLGGALAGAASQCIAAVGVAHIVVAVAAAAAAGNAQRWGLGGRRGVVAGQSRLATGGIAAWGLGIYRLEVRFWKRLE
jgi:hypothetical protein